MKLLLRLLINGLSARAGALLGRRVQAVEHTADGPASGGLPGTRKQQTPSRLKD